MSRGQDLLLRESPRVGVKGSCRGHNNHCVPCLTLPYKSHEGNYLCHSQIFLGKGNERDFVCFLLKCRLAGPGGTRPCRDREAAVTLASLVPPVSTDQRAWAEKLPRKVPVRHSRMTAASWAQARVGGGPPRGVPGPAAAASPENLLEGQILAERAALGCAPQGPPMGTHV